MRERESVAGSAHHWTMLGGRWVESQERVKGFLEICLTERGWGGKTAEIYDNNIKMNWRFHYNGVEPLSKDTPEMRTPL